MLTIHDVKERLSHLDEVTLLEVLDITSVDIVERFVDNIEDRLEDLAEELADDESYD